VQQVSTRVKALLLLWQLSPVLAQVRDVPNLGGAGAGVRGSWKPKKAACAKDLREGRNAIVVDVYQERAS
jgi:hypothetical protein